MPLAQGIEALDSKMLLFLYENIIFVTNLHETVGNVRFLDLKRKSAVGPAGCAVPVDASSRTLKFKEIEGKKMRGRRLG